MGIVLVLGLLLLPALGRLAALAVQRSRRRAEWRGVPAAPPSWEPLRGWKVAQVVVGHDERAWLIGVTGRSYGVDDTAGCDRLRCTPPGLDCGCGFYAFRERTQAEALLAELSVRHRSRTYVLLTVDLDGVVLEHELGFRAARQRVHRIEVPDVCAVCWRAGSPRPARRLVVHPSFRCEQLLVEGVRAPGATLAPGSAPVRAVCEEHDPDPSAQRLDLDRLRTLTMTEVALLAHPPS